MSLRAERLNTAGAGIPLRRAAGLIADMTGDVAPGPDEPRVQRAARYLQVDPFELVDAVEDTVISREIQRLHRVGGRRIA